MSKEAIKLQSQIVNRISKLYELGYSIETTYIEGAGWASQIFNRNTGENNELDEQEIIDAEQDKNKDYALDNMTCDISEEEQYMMDLESASIDQFNQEKGEENE